MSLDRASQLVHPQVQASCGLPRKVLKGISCSTTQAFLTISKCAHQGVQGRGRRSSTAPHQLHFNFYGPMFHFQPFCL